MAEHLSFAKQHVSLTSQELSDTKQQLGTTCHNLIKVQEKCASLVASTQAALAILQKKISDIEITSRKRIISWKQNCTRTHNSLKAC